MKILVTTGSGHFYSLSQRALEIATRDLDNIWFIQMNKPPSVDHENITLFEYRDDLDDIIDQCDLVITHTGAGTIYKLLELGKRLITLPNLERRDKHQLELANWLNSKRYCIVLRAIDDLTIEICNQAVDAAIIPYNNTNKFDIAKIL
jgi:beta-1,4-N-acetylglucosaminyltransferase